MTSEIAGIKLEIKILESQINAFDNEKIELEKVISDFQHRHTIELGEVILEVLRLRKIKYKIIKKKPKPKKILTTTANNMKLKKTKNNLS